VSRKLPWLAAWCVVVGFIPVLLWMFYVWVPSEGTRLRKRVQAAELKRQQLAAELKELDDQFTQDEDRFARIVRRFPWLADAGGGTAFLTRLSDVIADLSLKIQSIGPVKREETRQLAKVGRQVRLSGRFADILTLVDKVEENKALLEGVQVQRSAPKGDERASGEIEAQFHLITVELAPDVRDRLRAFGAAQPDRPDGRVEAPLGALLLPVPEPGGPSPANALRDPFQLPRLLPSRVGKAGGQDKSLEAAVVFPDLKLLGIIESPRGRIAIINNQTVKEGDRIEGVLVQAIRKHEVILKSPTEVRRFTLPELGSTVQLPEERSQ